MFRCKSRTRSENSNLPLKQVETVFAIYPSRAISRLLSQARRTPIDSYGEQPETRNPTSAISQARVCHPIVHVSRVSKFKFFPPNPHARHLAAAFTIHKRSPSSGCTRNHVYTQPLSFFKIPHQNPCTTARHLATMSKTRNRKYTYRPPLSTDSNHLTTVGNLARTQTLGR